MKTIVLINIVLFVFIYLSGALMQNSNDFEITWGMNVVLSLLLILPGFVVGLFIVHLNRRYDY